MKEIKTNYEKRKIVKRNVEGMKDWIAFGNAFKCEFTRKSFMYNLGAVVIVASRKKEPVWRLASP